MTSNAIVDNALNAERQRRVDNNEEFSIDKYLLSFLSENVFYAEISRRIQKVSTTRIPTAAVMWDPRLDNLCLLYNPKFLEQYSARQIRGILKHEYNHITFGHLSARRREPPRMWNVATDLAINSLIYAEEKASYIKDDDLPLPKCALVPGQPVYLADLERKMSKEEESARPIAALIHSFSPLLSSEDYFNALQEESEKHPPKTCDKCQGTGKVPKDNEGKDEKKDKGDKDDEESDEKGSGDDEDKKENGDGESEGDGDSKDEGDSPGDGHGHGEGDQPCPQCGGQGECRGGDGWIDSMDDHSMWDDIGDDEREYVEARARNIVEKAVEKADQEQNGWGNIPNNISSEIRKSISRIVPWRSVLRQFLGTLLPGGRTTSIKRINRRYPWIHPGVKRARAPGLLVAIDQSGSVNDTMLALFFAELTQLAKLCDIDILPFDCYADKKEIWRWKKGTQTPKGRERTGGTDFDAVTNIVNDPSCRGRWDGVLIVTDGECSEPQNTRIQRGWVLPPGHVMQWETNELQVFVEQKKAMKGAWR